MSPRAAWRLEAMGFAEVYDFTDGKLEWLASGLPTEGKGPHYAVAGEVATRDDLLVSSPDETTKALATKMRDDQTYCVIVNDQDIVLGRVRKTALSAGAKAWEVMEPGPTTVRPAEPAKPLLKRMNKRNVPAMLVTTSKGKLVGLAKREDLERLV